MKKQLLLLTISAAASAVSADLQAMMRRAPARAAMPRAQRVPVRPKSTISGQLKDYFKPSAQAWSAELHDGSSFRRIAERIKPTTEVQHNNQLRKVKEKFPLAYCTESRITREILLNHAKHDELCEKWLNAKKELNWNRVEALPVWLGTIPCSLLLLATPKDLLLDVVKHHPELFVFIGAVTHLQTKRVKIAKQEKKKVEDELAELAKEQKRELKLPDDIQ